MLDIVGDLLGIHFYADSSSHPNTEGSRAANTELDVRRGHLRVDVNSGTNAILHSCGLGSADWAETLGH
ncbi:MAG: hypothetical protein ABSC30_04910 [Acidimicrobiales bacterium]